MIQSAIIIKDVDMVLSDRIFNGDILIKEGRIVAIDDSIQLNGARLIKGKGLTLLPGCIDPHVHFREPGLTSKEDLFTGSQAAAAGGVTSFFDMPNTNPPSICAKAVQIKKDLASQKSIINYMD